MAVDEEDDTASPDKDQIISDLKDEVNGLNNVVKELKLTISSLKTDLIREKDLVDVLRSERKLYNALSQLSPSQVSSSQPDQPFSPGSPKSPW